MTRPLMASDAPATHTPVPQVILGNGNRRFSGVTSTLLQVLPHQMESMEIAVLGSAHMPSPVRTLNFFSALRLLRRAAMDRKPVVFHARRNIEMVQALLLRCLGASTLKIAFTSTAQRYHSRFTRYLMRQMDSVISTCSAAASYLDPPPDQLIPHGIDTARFHPRPNGEAPNRKALATAHQIGIFGRVRHQKGIDVLIEAAIPVLVERPDWGILVVGEIKPEDTSYVDELKRRINALPAFEYCCVPLAERRLWVNRSRGYEFGLRCHCINCGRVARYHHARGDWSLGTHRRCGGHTSQPDRFG
jgi:mannosyltransferase